MERAGYIKNYVQQNHDGLPQKSGFPQDKMNEIHGAWFDPSNPVVQFSGKLRSDLFDWLCDMELATDLCLCLGTSLSGMNADRVAVTCAKRSMAQPQTVYHFSLCTYFQTLGTVIMNLQQTPHDRLAIIRIWAKLDDALRILAQKLGLAPITPQVCQVPTGDMYVVPYNSSGKLDRSRSMLWDLRDVSIGITRVIDTVQNASVYIAQPEASNFGISGKILGKRADGHYKVLLNEEGGPVVRLLGSW